MTQPKITYLRSHYMTYENAGVRIPFNLTQNLLNMLRSIYRRLSFAFYSLGLTLATLVLVKSSKYTMLRQLHYEDLRDAMKVDEN